MALRVQDSAFVFGVFLSVVTANAQSGEEAEYWHGILDQNSLEEISTAFRASSLPWPRITTATELASKMLARLRENEGVLGAGVEDESAIMSSIGIYAELAKGFRVGGGYYNYLLLDVVNRISLARIAAFVENDPGRHRLAATWMNMLHFPSFDKRSFSEMLESQMADAGVRAKLESLPDGSLIEAVLDLLGADSDNSFREFSGESANASRMIDRKDIAILVWRILETDTVGCISLPALLHFLELGGTREEIRLDDISRFRDIMGTRGKKFRSDLLGINQVYPSHLKSLLDQFGSSWSESRFYQVAIQ